MEAKDNWADKETIEPADINHISENANDAGGFRDTLNAGETINGGTLPVAVYQDPADNEIYACDGNDATKQQFLGFAISNSTNGNPINVQLEGIVRGFTGLTEGVLYYVKDDKTIGTTPGTYPLAVGRAISETEILIVKEIYAFKAGAGARSNASGSGTVTITHGLGRIPKIIRIDANAVIGNAPLGVSRGIIIVGSTISQQGIMYIDLTNQFVDVGTFTGAINTYRSAGSQGWVGSVSNVTATTFDLVLTATVFDDGTLNYLWEVE